MVNKPANRRPKPKKPDMYSPRNDPDPEMIPNPEMIPKSTPKWSPINSWNGMEFHHGIITNLLQRLTFRYSLCDFLALFSSNRLYVYFCIFNIILKF